ncbi:MAG: hypothetical protein ACREV8_09860, partial [Gammaproteobacteria bacterium]
KLGTVNFPTSAQSKEAQTHFLRGVAALHSFWYPVAIDEFRAAIKVEPDFMMGYWGEAMAHNHPIWSARATKSRVTGPMPPRWRKSTATIPTTPRPRSSTPSR